MTPRLAPVDFALPEYGVFALESEHAPGFRMAPSRHAFLEIFYVLHGAGAFAIAGKNHPCREHDVVVVPPGDLHEIRDNPDGPLGLYGVGIAPSILAIDPDAARLPAGCLPLNPLAVPQVRADLRQLLFEQTLARPGYRAALVGRTLQFLGLLVRGTLAARPAPTAAPSHLAAVQHYLDELPHRFYESTSLDDTAAALGMSRRRFTQLFRELAGTSWLDYLTNLRVEYAGRLLRETPRTVIGIAFECGFEDLSSFYRAFKSRNGTTPSEWRASG